eukprot:scaffold3237_cov148-Skeletonema_marinoi.AAC.1
METRIKELDIYALSKIGKDSVYSYFVTDKVFGWIAALITLGIQFGIFVFFIHAAEANLQDNRTDIQFTWKCPRDTDVCSNKADLTDAGWAIYCVLMVSTVYNKAIATSNTEIIVNSVIVLFIMDLDEWIFSALEAINDDWTSHVAKSEDEMKVQIASQQEELKNLREIVERIQDSLTQMDQIASEKEELRKLHEIVDKMLESNASSAHSEHVVSGSESNVYAQQLETEHVDDIVVPYEA